MFAAPRPTLGQTIYLGIVGALLLIAVGFFAWGQFSSWRAGNWKDRAKDAQAAAGAAQANADSANAGAANATLTRQNMDAGTVTVRVETEAAARRIEGYANRPAPVADLAPVDPDVVRELEAAEDRARAAADRLRRKYHR